MLVAALDNHVRLANLLEVLNHEILVIGSRVRAARVAAHGFTCLRLVVVHLPLLLRSGDVILRVNERALSSVEVGARRAITARLRHLARHLERTC